MEGGGQLDFYFTNRQFELQEIISTTTSTEIVMADEEDKLSIENGSRTLTGTLYFTNKQSTQVKVAAAIGNYILYHDKNEKDVWMTIVEIEHNPLNGTHTFVAESAGLDLLNELVGSYKADKAYNIAYYINKFTFDSGFKIGFNEIPKLTRKLEWDSEDSTALARVLSVATQFDNAEIEFSFAVEGTNVLKKYINIYKKRGKDNRQTLYVNVDVNNIIVKSDIYELATAIYVQGGTPDGKNSPINLKGYKWTDTDGRYILGSDGILRDKENGAKWSRLLPGQANPNGAYILRRKSFETTDQKTLLDNALRELKKVSEPIVNYEVDIAVLPKGVSVGDTVYLVHESEEVYLKARVLELSYVYSTKSYTAVLGDYLIQDGGVTQNLIDLANSLRDQVNRKKYDVKLEATAQAFVDKKGTITIVAKVFDGTLDVSTNFSEYKWSRIDSEGIADPDWTNITNTVTILADDQPLWTYICEVSNLLDDGTSYLIGSDRLTIVNLQNGAVGEPGKAGADGKTSYFHTAYADDDQGLNFSTTDSNRSWMGTYSDFEPLDSSDYSKYAWSKVKGEKGDQGVQGLQGPQGNQGIAGPKGVDGKTQYTHIAYANSADGIVDFSVSDSDREYIGVYVDFTATDSTTPSDYAWTLVKGADGTSGTPGKPGTDGKTPYFHTAWSNSADGTDGFTTGYPNLNLFKNTKSQSYTSTGTGTNNSSNTYPLDGVVADISNKQITITYNYAITNSTGTWSGTIRPTYGLGGTNQSVSNIKLSGTHKETVTLTADSQNSYGILTSGLPTGTKVTITNLKVEFGSTATPWMPSASEVKTADWPSYIGQYSDFTQADSTKPSDYTWSLIRGNDGKDGEDGKDGIAGKDGVGIKTTAITYAQSTSGTTAPTSGWTASVPTLIKGQYLWTQTVWTYTDNSTEAGYSVSYNAKDGNNGTDGIAGKDGVGIANTKVEYVGSTSGTTKPTSGWSTTIPTVAEGNYLWTRTTWAYTDNSTETGYSVAKMGTKGDKGDQGPQGDPTGVTESATVPANPYSGMLWKCTGTLAGYQQNAIYRWNGSEWEIWTFSAVNIIAETFNGLTFTGVTIKASEFISSYNIETSGKSYKGELSIGTGMYINDYESNDGTKGRFSITRIGDIVNGRSHAGASQQYELTPSGLGLRDGEFNGILTAQALTKTEWVNLSYASGYTTAENNPCQYRIFYQLDGSRLIRFRGQFKKSSGNLNNGANYPFINLPSVIKPNRTEFGYLPTGADGTTGNNGGRIAMVTAPQIVCHTTDSHQAYGAISGLSYIID